MAIKLKVPDRRPAARSASKSNSRPAAKAARVRHFSLRDPLVKIFVVAFVIAWRRCSWACSPTSTSSTSAWSIAAWLEAFSATRPRFTRARERFPWARRWTLHEVAAELRRAGYAEGGSERRVPPIGHYTLTRGGIEIMPGPQSFHASNAAQIRFSGGKVASITESGDNSQDLAGLRARTATGDRAVRRPGPLQARAHQVRGHSASAGECGAGDRGPPILPARRRELLPPDGSGGRRCARRSPRTRRIDADHAAVARLLPDAGEDASSAS